MVQLVVFPYEGNETTQEEEGTCINAHPLSGAQSLLPEVGEVR